MGPANEAVVLAILREAAIAGRRCPTNPQIHKELIRRGYSSWPAPLKPSELAYRGLIKSEVYANNWRVIEIDGHRTAEAPNGWQCYLIIDIKA